MQKFQRSLRTVDAIVGEGVELVKVRHSPSLLTLAIGRHVQLEEALGGGGEDAAAEARVGPGQIGQLMVVPSSQVLFLLNKSASSLSTIITH